MRRYLLSLAVVSIYVTRFLTGNLYGVCLLLSGIYFFVPLLTDIHFFSFSELLVWINSTPTESKTLIVSSLLTIIGFLIAFQSATKNWKDQLQANLRLDAGREIDRTYNQATRLINQLRIYADMFLELGNKVEEKGLTKDTHFGIHYLCQQSSQFIQNRKDVSEIHIDVYSMYGRYGLMFLSCGQTFKNLSIANRSLKEVTEKMWILTPDLDLESVTLIKDFLNYFDKDKLEGLSRQCELSSQAISTLTGNVKGQLNSKIMEFNLRFVLSFIKFGPLFFDMKHAVDKGEVINSELIRKLEAKL